MISLLSHESEVELRLSVITMVSFKYMGYSWFMSQCMELYRWQNKFQFEFLSLLKILSKLCGDQLCGYKRGPVYCLS